MPRDPNAWWPPKGGGTPRPPNPYDPSGQSGSGQSGTGPYGTGPYGGGPRAYGGADRPGGRDSGYTYYDYPVDDYQPEPVRADWLRLGQVDPAFLSQTRREVHRAVQWLARTAYAARPAPAQTGSPARLLWDGDNNALVTHELTDYAGRTRLGFSFTTASIMMLRDGHRLREEPVGNLMDSELGRRLASQSARLGIDPAHLQHPLPYPLGPDRQRDKPYTIGSGDPRLLELSRWFANAHGMFQELRALYGHRRPGPTEVDVSPEHLDLSMLIVLEERSGDRGRRSIHVGLSPGDAVFDEPYFYVIPEPAPARGQLRSIPMPAVWHQRAFTGIILRGGDLVRSDDAESTAWDMLNDAIEACQKLLRHR